MTSEACGSEPRRACIFVSAVSRELGTARAIAGHCLRVFRNVDVVFQQEFGTESGELLAMLRRRIDECDGVLQLIGDAYGAAPDHPDDAFGEVSYTQFEFLYAIARGKLTWLVRVAGNATRNILATEPVSSASFATPSNLVLDSYEARLRLSPGLIPTIRAEDTPELKAVLAEHARRRALQSQYAARLKDHLEHIVNDDDELVKTIRDLRGIDSPRRQRGLLAGLHLPLEGSFVGRAALVADILTELNPFDRSQIASRRLVVHGLGGSGKTTLATEIGHYQSALGRNVLMLRATSGDGFDQALSRLSEDPALGLTGGAPVMREWLRTHGDWLMIVDGVDDRESAAAVHEFCAAFQSGHFLITSCFAGYWRSASAAQQFRCYDVDMLSDDAAHRLLRLLLERGRQKSDSEADTRKLIPLLGGLPLAVRHASGFLNNNMGDSVGEYIRTLESSETLPDAGEDFAAPPRAVAATWQANLRRVSPSARTLLRLLSFLTDHPLPTRLLYSPEVERAFHAACLADPFEGSTGPPGTLRNAARELSAYSLLRLESSHFVVHRLVLRMTQANLRNAAADMLPAGLAFQQALVQAGQPLGIDASQLFLKHVIRLLTDYLEVAGRSGWPPLYPHLSRLITLYLEAWRTGTVLTLAPDELLVVAEALALGGHYAESLNHCTRAAASERLTTLLAARAHTQLAWDYFNERQLAVALEHYALTEQALQTAPKNSQFDEARYYLYSGRGWLYRYIGKVNEGLADYQCALALATERGQAHEQSDAFMGLGGVQDYAGNRAAADSAYANAVRLAEAAKDPWLQAVSRYMFGYFKIRQGSRLAGITMCREAMEIADRYTFSDVVEESAWILAVGLTLEGNVHAALEMAERATENPSPVLEAWDHVVRGIVRFRLSDLQGARIDFEKSLTPAVSSTSDFECFEDLDTAAFAHAGLTLIGEEDHRRKAIATYQRARTLAPASGINDINLVVFSCFGDDPSVLRLKRDLSDENAQ
jgi:tetratricopeptide (TPR) repeat protein